MPRPTSEFEILLNELRELDRQRPAGQPMAKAHAPPSPRQPGERDLYMGRGLTWTIDGFLHAQAVRREAAAKEGRDGRRAQVQATLEKAMALFNTGAIGGHDVRRIEARANAILATL